MAWREKDWIPASAGIQEKAIDHQFSY